MMLFYILYLRQRKTIKLSKRNVLYVNYGANEIWFSLWRTYIEYHVFLIYNWTTSLRYIDKIQFNMTFICYSDSHIIWNRHGHECWRIWKLSAHFTSSSASKYCRDCFRRYILGTIFLWSNLVSNANFRAEKKILLRRDLMKFENSNIT